MDHIGKGTNCCVKDSPFCDYQPKIDTITNEDKISLSVDAAIFDPWNEDYERLHVFYRDKVFTFRFKDEARDTPILEQSEDNTYELKSQRGWNVPLADPVAYAIPVGDAMLLKLGDKDDGDKAAFHARKTEVKDRKKKVVWTQSSDPPFWATDKNDGPLFSGAFLHAHGKKGSILAFYGIRNKVDPYEYTIKLWDLESGKEKAKVKVKGRLVAATGRRVIGTVGSSSVPSRGFYFTNDGRVCKFELPPPPSIEIEVEKLISDYPHPCWSFQTFLGCPPSLCYSPDIDDMAFHQWNQETKPGSISAISAYVIFREKFYWIVPGKRGELPIPAPTITKSDFIEYGQFPFEQGLELVDAAFSFEEEGVPKLYTMKETIVKYYEGADLPSVPVDSVQSVFENAPNNSLVDTAVYNSQTKKLLMFFGDQYGYFVRQEDTMHQWRLDGELMSKSEDFQDVPLYFEGSIDGNGQLYFTFGPFHTKLSMGDDPKQNSFTIHSSLGQQGGDSVLFYGSECNYADKSIDLVTRYQNNIPQAQEFKSKDSSKGKTGLSTWAILLITAGVTAFGVVVVLIFGAFIFLGRGRQARRGRPPTPKSTLPKSTIGKSTIGKSVIQPGKKAK